MKYLPTNLICLMVTLIFFSCNNQNAGFKAEFHSTENRIWIGEQFWARPLMDWRIKDGKLQCINGGRNHSVNLMTHYIPEGAGKVSLAMHGGVNPGSVTSTGLVGFKVGITGDVPDFRSAAVLGKGIFAGLRTDGSLVIGDSLKTHKAPVELLNDFELNLVIETQDKEARVHLICSNPADADSKFSYSVIVKDEEVAGYTALVCKDAENRDNGPTGWFSEWDMQGDKLEVFPEQTFGPVLWSQYTLSGEKLKMLSFFAPLNADNNEAFLEIRESEEWVTIDEATVDTLSYSCLFETEGWKTGKDVPYRIVFPFTENGEKKSATWEGIVRKEPKEKEVKLAAMSCLGNLGFPHRHLTTSIEQHDPDVLFFAGDQIYEGNDGFGTVIAENEPEVKRAMLNYLPKWWMFGWTYRNLLKDRPAVMTVDDHDLFQNDYWGKGGEKMGENRCFGGYLQPVTWINAVEHTQMGHLPDPVDPDPIKRGIHVHFTRMKYGGLDLAVIEDRKFKSAPGDILKQPVGHNNMHNLETIKSTDFNPEDVNDDDLVLLGKRQLNFLRDWAEDKNNSYFKAVFSSSPFCIPHHGYGGMVADLDGNGWPQSGRNRALRIIRDANAIMVHGDLHLSNLVQHGIDEFRDGPWSYTSTASAAVSRRVWRPDTMGMNRHPDDPWYTGDFFDGLGNRMTIVAIANPGSDFELNYREDNGSVLDHPKLRGSGFGIIRFNKSKRQVTFESWPLYGESVPLEKREQHPGWPHTIEVPE